MSIPCARYFAADWEGQSFLEFFIDLQGRVASDPRASAGRTSARLRDHARFALQMALLRSVDSYFAYVADAEQLAREKRNGSRWLAAISGGQARHELGVSLATARNDRNLAYTNLRQLDRSFAEVTNIHLFDTPTEIERITRLVLLRSFIAHGRTFAADDLAAFTGRATSVGGIGLKLSAVREDLATLRAWVARTDHAVAEIWDIERPITSSQLFEVIAQVARGEAGLSQDSDLPTVKAAED